VDGHRAGAGHEDGDATGPHPAAAWSGVAKGEERANRCATNAKGVAGEGDMAEAIGAAAGHDGDCGRCDGDAGARDDASARRDGDPSSPIAPRPEPMRSRPYRNVTRTLPTWLPRVAMWLPPVSLATPFGKMVTHSRPMAIPPRLAGIRPSDT
jgi:hypothetical protein